MNGKIIFVGLHNKPKMEPLDSRTKSGQIIDKIIKRLKGRLVLKTNLFNTDYYPDKDHRESIRFYWHDSVCPAESDTVVLLGGDVQKYFDYSIPVKRVIKVAHPASRRHLLHDYIESVANEILSTE